MSVFLFTVKEGVRVRERGDKRDLGLTHITDTFVHSGVLMLMSGTAQQWSLDH